MNDTQKVQPGDLIYSGASVALPNIPGSGRMFVVVETDSQGNATVLPVSSVRRAVSESTYLVEKNQVEGRSMKNLIVSLDVEVHMSAKWPMLRQPMHLTSEAVTHLLEARTGYKEQHDVTLIHTDQPVGFEKELFEQVDELYTNFKNDPQQFLDYLAFSSKFYEYSARNQALIYRQNPHATFVASRQGWDKLKYSIRPEHINRYLILFRPEERTYFERDGHLITISKATAEERLKIASGELEVIHKTKFVEMKAYDISQTTCPIEDYPKIYSKGQADPAHDQLYLAVKRTAELSGIQVMVEDVSSIALGGYYNRAKDLIVISDKENDTRKALVMLHEYSHALLHNTSAPSLHREVKEFEAQTLAVRLMQHYGFPLPHNEQEYIVSYLTVACQNPAFKMDESLNRLAKQFIYAKDRITAQLNEIAPQQPEPAQQTQRQSKNLPRTAEISENFLMNL